jgi:hypothetical protein
VCLVEEADSVWNWFGMGGTVHVHLCEGRDRSNVGKCSVEDVQLPGDCLASGEAKAPAGAPESVDSRA